MGLKHSPEGALILFTHDLGLIPVISFNVYSQINWKQMLHGQKSVLLP